MVTINANYDKRPSTYLFAEIARRTKAHQATHPDAKIMRLGIGNVSGSNAIAPTVLAGLKRGAELCGSTSYSGYGDEQGDTRLREAIAQSYIKHGVVINSKEVFVSDGAKCDVANIQSLFGLENVVAIQDPAYPVYVDTNILSGRDNIVYMPCTKENGFFPDLPKQKVDLIYLCSPNNPTGAVGTKRQIKKVVDFANDTEAVIIFDAAYSSYIRDIGSPQDRLPRTIYEVPGAEKCAIEVQSFSKSAGTTGVRLGWSVVPMDLLGGKLNAMWNRRSTTFFNGASCIAQEGGLAALTEQGQQECQKMINYYMGTADVLNQGFRKKGFEVASGGDNAPYLWVKTPGNMNSWDFFDKMLDEAKVVITPGVGFGPSGQGYFRVSAFGTRENAEAALKSIQENLKI